ncbi:MAG: tRNA (adenosine(37)-N6)-dimethylallyltransferase MiaA [Clostridia bacterium]|nr:tRNA (adenosine(37)-N6)-dimethylallyltransferase MiaA [Clostridia bacterium]
MVQTNSVNKPKIIVISGTTAIGKTELSVKIAKEINGEIISCDSMQMYKYANIGTAKISKEEMQGVKHYMIDFLEPNFEFSAGEFQKQASKIINDIISKNKVPIIVGGTGLYIQSLLFPFSATSKRDEELRNKLNDILKNEGKEALYAKLKEVDKETANTLHINQTDRIIRALEIYYTTGKKKSELIKTEQSPYDYLLIILVDDREAIYNRINKRTNKMISSGLIDETKDLINSHNVTLNSPIMKAIGYKECLEYLNGEINKDELIESISKNTRHYAKRQITYLKKIKGAMFLNRNNYEEIIKQINVFLRNE